MTLVIPDGFAQAAWRFSMTGDPEVMVTTIGLETGVVGQVVAEEFADTWLSQFPAGNMSAGWTFLGAVLRVGQPSGPPLILEAPRNIAGTQGGPSLPNNCTLLIKKRSTLGGRQGRGRMYVPMTSVGEESVNRNGLIDQAVVESLQTAWTNIYGQLDAVILHDSSGPITVPTPITALIVDPRIATQRRRMRS
jgi:hypothetical protein